MSTQLVVTAVGAAQPKKTVRRNAALQEGIELVLDEGRQARTRGGLALGEEGLGMLLHRCFSAVSLLSLFTHSCRTISSPGLMKWSISARYCVSYSCL